MPTTARESIVRLARGATLRAARLAIARLDPPGGDGGPATAAHEPDIYESLYEAHALSQGDETVVGELSLAPIEHEIVRDAGLKPDGTLLDLGCGIGRLACEVIPWMQAGGVYIGTDVSDSMLTRAAQRVAQVAPDPACSVRWIKQVGNTFALKAGSVDVVCAFSVFTHIEHEDAFGFLRDARRIIRPGGRFVFSCLPMDMEPSRFLFHQSGVLDVTERWSRVRNVATSVDYMDAISNMAGWEPETWIPGDPQRFGQSLCVLKPLPDEQLAARENPWDL